MLPISRSELWLLSRSHSINKTAAGRLWVIREKWLGNIRYRPEAETVACDSCVDVVEIVVTNSSPATSVVDFQTSFTSIAAANQPRRHWRTCVLLILMNIHDRPRYSTRILLQLRFPSDPSLAQGRVYRGGGRPPPPPSLKKTLDVGRFKTHKLQLLGAFAPRPPSGLCWICCLRNLPRRIHCCLAFYMPLNC